MPELLTDADLAARAPAGGTVFFSVGLAGTEAYLLAHLLGL